ncbi:MAG: DNA primase [Patescibacteria group bacterium]
MNNNEVEEIKSRLNVVDVIQDYLKLIPAGTSYKALCPFHNEKTPSFMVNPVKGNWRCFGCSEGGDIFDFLMKIENIDFPEAKKILANRAGVVLERHNPQVDSQKNRLYDACDLAAKYWHRVLLESSLAEGVRQYLKDRGINEDSIVDFRLGYSIDDWDNLVNLLKKKGFSDQEIFLAGLSVKKDKGFGFYDRFRGRLMFPIVDYHGNVVGFGGRALKSDEPAKYINTPQTLIYNKSQVLYGINRAKEQIRKKDVCVLVEGYMDVIPSHQAGIKNVVSISGTALTSEQLAIIKRYSNNLYLSLDMDAAGQLAADRSIDLALAQGVNIKVISLPQGKDPGECVKNNPQDWIDAIAKAESVMDYFLGKVTTGKDLGNPDEKMKAIKFLLGKIIKIGDKLEQDHWIQKISQEFSVQEKLVREAVANNSPQTAGRKKVNNETINKGKQTLSAEALIFQRLLAVILAFPKIMSKIADDLLPEDLAEPLFFTLYKNLILFYTKNIDLFDALSVDNSEFDMFPALNQWLEHDQLVSEEGIIFLGDAFLLSQKDFSDTEYTEALSELDNLIKKIKDNSLNKKINSLKERLTRAEKGNNPQEAEAVYRQLSELVKQKS